MAYGLVLTLVVAAGCERQVLQLGGDIRIATGSPAAVYYVYGSAYARLIKKRLPNVKPTVLVTPASGRNVAMLLDGRADVAFAQADAAAEAAKAAPPRRFVALARLYDEHLHLLVRDDSPFRKLTDLKGGTVAIGELDSGTSLTTERLLTVAGIVPGRDVTTRAMTLDESVSALRANKIDALFFSGGLPVGAITELARHTNVRPLDLREYIKPMRSAYGPYYSERVMPGSTYGLDPVVSISVATYLVVSSDMSDQMAYELTKTLITGREALATAHPAGARLTARNAICTKPLTLHPAAARYYRSIKRS